MSCKRYKDLSKAKHIWKIRTPDGFYFHVYLWKNHKDFVENTSPDVGYEALGCCSFNPTFVGPNGEEKIYPKLGEVHFIKGKWDMEVVVHELTHALFYILTLWPLKSKDEPYERNCLMFGDWVNQIYLGLWKYDPNKNWEKTGCRT